MAQLQEVTGEQVTYRVHPQLVDDKLILKAMITKRNRQKYRPIDDPARDAGWIAPTS